MKLPNLVLVILSVFDIVTTWIILEHGGKELNPLMAPLGIGGILIIRIIVVIGIIYIIEKHLVKYSELHPIIEYAPLVIYISVSTIWTFAIIHNLIVLF